MQQRTNELQRLDGGIKRPGNHRISLFPDQRVVVDRIVPVGVFRID